MKLKKTLEVGSLIGRPFTRAVFLCTRKAAHRAAFLKLRQQIISQLGFVTGSIFTIRFTNSFFVLLLPTGHICRLNNHHPLPCVIKDYKNNGDLCFKCDPVKPVFPRYILASTFRGNNQCAFRYVEKGNQFWHRVSFHAPWFRMVAINRNRP